MNGLRMRELNRSVRRHKRIYRRQYGLVEMEVGADVDEDVDVEGPICAGTDTLIPKVAMEEQDVNGHESECANGR